MEEKTKEQDEKDKVEEEKLDLERKQREDAGFIKRLIIYNKPCFFIVLGVFFSIIAGALLPTFGIWFVKMLFLM
jgi:uncharacterized membrane protein